MTEEPHKLADEELTTSSESASGDGDAPAADNGLAPNGQASESSRAAESDAAADEPDDSEVVPVEVKPLSRPAPAGTPEALAAAAKKKSEAADDIEFKHYILKVQSNREKSIAAALQRKVRVEGLDRYFDKDENGDPWVKVPTEKVTEFKAGKKKIVERKLYPGYIVVKMHITDETWFAVRDTAGIGDFTGAGGKPSPMLAHEVARITQSAEEESDEAPKLDIKFKTGDRMKVKDGTFEGFEGEVGAIDPQSGKITVMINIFGRSTPVELEYWQIEAV
jgi:transcription termination/antitermination protein NusG